MGKIEPLTKTRELWIGIGFITIGLCLKLRPLLQPMSGDVWLYFHTADGLLWGVLPYSDRPFPYPPYALIWFLPPLVSRQPHVYSALFSVEMMIIELALQGCILWSMRHHADSSRSAMCAAPNQRGGESQNRISPLVAILLYTLGSVSLQNIIWERFDLAAAAIMLIAFQVFASGSAQLSGAIVALGTFTKVFPILALPILAAAAWRQRKTWSFLFGVALGVLPLIGISFVLPWWRFVGFQTGRGLQVESLGASLLWLLHQVIGIRAEWVKVSDWFEVGGPIAGACLPWVIGIWIFVTLISVFIGARYAIQFNFSSSPYMLRAIYLPILGFVTFGNVLSPQFLIWLLPVFAANTGYGSRLEGFLFVLACAFSSLIFPSPQYESGINFFQSLCLFLRNGILVCLWVLWLRALVFRKSTRSGEGKQENADALFSRAP